jgi:mannonate dehydratase
MNRRRFVRLAGTGMAAGALAETLVAEQVARTPSTAKPSASNSKVKFHVGTQHGDSDAILKAMAAFGCNNICGSMPSAKLDEKWSVEALTKHREHVESYGIKLDMMPITMTSASIDRAQMPAIFLGKSPERDRNIDDICTQIRNCAKAGIFQVKYNFTIIGIPRSGRVKGRGPSTYSEFVLAKDENKDKPTLAGKVSEDEYWERITYFLERVVPVANEYKVKMGCHPQDPGVPRGYRGIEAVPLATPAGLKRFVSIKESPYHGLNFCQGTVSEQLERPGEQIFDVIRDLGGRKKIFNVHFRNIEGGYLNFRESFIDNGSIDMLKAARVYKEVGYDGMLMPDHVPNVDGDPDHMQGFAFAIGYIKAIIAAVSAEA